VQVARHAFCSAWLTLAVYTSLTSLIEHQAEATNPNVHLTFRPVDISRHPLASGSLATSEDLFGETDR
jgi:hypothetical protein